MKKSYFLFPFVAILLWAGNVIVSKLSARTIDPSAITFYRLLLAVALMSLFTLKPAWRNREAIVPQLPKLAVLGFLAMALFQSLSYEAAKTTTATNMSIITALVPLMTMVASTLLLGEAPTTGMVGGGVLSLAGVVYLITQGNPAMLLANGAHLGDLLMILAALAYALYGVLLKRWHVGLPSWQSTYLQALFALVFMLPMLLRLPAAEAMPTRASVPLILYAGVLASVVLPFLWMQGVKHLGPNRCALFMNVLPIATALIAITMLGETLHMYHVLGGGTALVGVIVAQMFKRPAAQAATARD
ncbi:DMT family transporter [Paraburkholderia fungorum]|uniref:Drug/metabolite transporter (DMT)-like permease n=1 Tax=Paraburkholderia fungorum TaxID=134537 RepID=A0AAW3US28_9BURK|nr:DMT family transporter [Paraburkholderia fungorum]MBB4513137.1 drug/metabolite transporter (DMT)-like permease [Paraburkholderia fungorum]MBB6201437.1 drug/metabolite transporter (DMT)-like permease [Paraburkholderia fungorum]